MDGVFAHLISAGDVWDQPDTSFKSSEKQIFSSLVEKKSDRCEWHNSGGSEAGALCVPRKRVYDLRFITQEILIPKK